MFPQNSYVETLAPSVIVLGGGKFWGGNEMNAFIRRDTKEVISLSWPCEAIVRSPLLQARTGPHQNLAMLAP